MVCVDGELKMDVLTAPCAVCVWKGVGEFNVGKC